jgi:hypothetical protein
MDCQNGYDMYLNYYSARPIQAPNSAMYVSAYYYSSDKKLKTDIEYISSNVISKLKPAHFKWIKSGEYDYGFIAQDVQEVLPEAVVENRTQIGDEEENVTLTLNNTAIIAHLVAHAQEQQTKIENLEKQLAYILEKIE